MPAFEAVLFTIYLAEIIHFFNLIMLYTYTLFFNGIFFKSQIKKKKINILKILLALLKKFFLTN